MYHNQCFDIHHPCSFCLCVSRVCDLRLHIFWSVTHQCETWRSKILPDLEVLQEIPAGDFIASDLFLHQSLWSQQERHQIGQLLLKIIIDV